jgi:hypothetical protein
MGVVLVVDSRLAELAPLTLNGRVHGSPEPSPIPPTAKAVAAWEDFRSSCIVIAVEDDSFEEVPDGTVPPELFALASFPKPTAIAVQTLERAVRDDASYRDTWHATFACAAMDEGVDHETAQKIAARCVAALSPSIAR